MSVLIKNAFILTQNNKREHFQGSIYIEDQRITQISKTPITVEADYKIDGRKQLVLPGLINTHTHIPMTLLRGYADDMVLKQWLSERIWPVEKKLNKKSVEIGTQLGLLEMIASGTTTYLDMYFFEDIIGKTTEAVGIRGYLGFPLIDVGTPEYGADELYPRCEQFIQKWKSNDLIQPVVAPHGVYTCGPETLQKAAELSQKYNTILHIHCSETREEVYDTQKQYGVRPVEQLKKYDLLCKNMILAHCGWITKEEIRDIHHAQASVSHCPVSNMKIATGGFAPIPELLNLEVSVGLGTDGAASNNVLDMFDTMKFCALLHKQHRWDPQVLPAQTVLDCATRNGAQCLGKETELGSLEENKIADVVLINLQKPHLTPLHSIVSHLVYAAKGSDVSTTIVNGKPLMIDGTFLTLDYEKTIEKAQEYALELTS